MTSAWLRRAVVLRAAAVGLVGLGVAATIVAGARTRSDETESRDAAAAAASAVLPVVRAVDDRRAPGALAADAATRSVAAGGATGLSTAVAAQARDTGDPVLDDARGGLVVTARYDPPGPTTVAARRASVVGYSVTPLDLASTLDSLSRDGASIALLGPSHLVAAGTGFEGSGSDAVRYTVPLGGSVAPGWRLQTSVAHRPLSAPTGLLAMVALLAGLVGAAVTAHRAGLRVHSLDAASRRKQADATLAQLGTIAQSSLDLAEVLPASCALLEADLDLRGLTLLGLGTRPTFVWRDAPREHEPSWAAHAPVPADSCVDVPLTRGGRSLGVLRVRPRRVLDETDVHTLARAAAILSSAIANSDAYAHQQVLLTRMRELDDLKTVFVATASHELRTPVAAVVGYSTMLTESWDSLDSETGLLYAQRVERTAQRLASLVENLLDFARLEQGRSYTGEEELLDLGTEVASLIDAQPDLAPHHELVASAEPGWVVAGSRLAIERVVCNLVGNAAKYSPAGTTISVRVQGGDAVRLTVDDQGPGIPPAERHQIFSRFFRGAGDAVVRTRGAGLGLSIVTEFATSMGGVVSIATAPGGGSRFEVTYPLHHSEAGEPVLHLGEIDVHA